MTITALEKQLSIKYGIVRVCLYSCLSCMACKSHLLSIIICCM